MLALLSLLAFIIVITAGYGLFILAQERNVRREALSRRLATMTGPVSDVHFDSLLRDLRLSNIPLLDTILNRIPMVPRVVRMIRQAGLRKRVGEVLLYVPLLGGIAFLVTVLMGGGRAAGLLAGLVLASLPLVVVSRIRAKRMRAFAEQLPDALDLMRSALQAGHGIQAAYAVVGETLPDPVSMEFRQVVEEMRLGRPMREALYNLADRMGDVNIPILIVGVLVSQEVGGNLAEVIDNCAHTIRERAKLQRQVKALTAQGRLSGTVLTLLPFFVGVAMYAINPVYYEPMTRSVTGHYMILYACASLLYGHFLIRRIVNIEV
jgi:tight adherence protein B